MDLDALLFAIHPVHLGIVSSPSYFAGHRVGVVAQPLETERQNLVLLRRERIDVTTFDDEEDEEVGHGQERNVAVEEVGR